MQAVPIGFFLFLVQLAAGGIVVTTLLDWDGEVSPGFLFLNGIFLLGFAAAGIWLRTTLPAARLLPYEAPVGWLGWEVGAWVAFGAATAVQLVGLKLERRRLGRVAGTAAAALGLGALTVSANAYLPPGVPLVLMLASFLAAALALGTVWSGMMLGHWYLVTPRLAPRPLLRLNAALAATLVVQGALLLAQAAATPAGLEPGWLFALRSGVGIVFPLVLCLLIWRTARVKSMMSATGLLYIALGTVLSGEIIAKALLFIAQVPA
jgi:hypothetical protein